MSEFSSGIMLRACHKDIALKYMEDNSCLIQLNDFWLCRLSENGSINYSEEVLNLSEHIPLLYISNAEDYGFLLEILHHKKESFIFSIPYGFELVYAFKLGEQLYGDSYTEQMNNDDVEKNIEIEMKKRATEIEAEFQSFFSNINTEQVNKFRLFGFEEDTCEKIQHILTCQNYKKDFFGNQMIGELLDTIKLREFHFISYSYVTNYPEDHIFLQ